MKYTVPFKERGNEYIKKPLDKKILDKKPLDKKPLDKRHGLKRSAC